MVRDDVAVTPAVNRRVLAFVCIVLAIGILVIARAVGATIRTPPGPYVLLLALLTIVSGRFAIKVPGRPATVSVSEIFVFTSVLLFGPGPATLTVAADGLITSLMHSDRRLYRALFNVSEPAISTWLAASVCFALAGGSPLSLRDAHPLSLILPTAGLTATYFLLNSMLTAVAVSLETGAAVSDLWRRDAPYLAVNYYAAASLAMLAATSGSVLSTGVIGLVVPLLILSYVAYKEATVRIDAAHRHVRDVEHLYRATIETLAMAVDAKDQVTHGHIQRVQRHTLALAAALGVSDETELKALDAAAILHDVGKMAVPDYVLNKPGALSPAEWATMRLHAGMGATILSAANFPYPVVPIARHHHEQWDGLGYPDGLAGQDIPYGARILSVVDCFDALTSDRPYRRKLTDPQAIRILRERTGSFYDPAVVEAFIELVPALRRDDSASARSQAPAAPVSQAAPLGGECVWQGGAGDGTVRTSLGLIAPGVMKQLERLMPSSEAALFALAPDGDVLVVAFTTPRIDQVARNLRIRVGQGLSGWVAAQRFPIVNSEADLDLGDATLGLGLGSCSSVPVFARGNLIGVLTIYRHNPYNFSPGDVRLVGEMAQDIGLEFTRWENETVHASDRTVHGNRHITAAERGL
jgi:putative nucleotidyltransferase with HDIG domain